MPKRILITGGMGFFGWNAARYLASRNYLPILASSLVSRYPNEVSAKAVFLNVFDEHSIEECFAKHNPDAVIHAAALSAPMQCEQNPALAAQINVLGTRNMLAAAKRHNAPIIFLSTDLVFCGNKNVLQDGFYTETDAPDATIVYGRTKREAERVFEKSDFDKWIILRSSLMFGRGVAWTNGFPQFAVNLLKSGKETTLFYDQFRTPAYIPDIVEAILKLTEAEIFGEIFHCGGAERIDRVSFVKRYCAEANIETSGIIAASMNDIPNYTTRVNDVSLSNTKLHTALQNTGQMWQERLFYQAFREMLQEESTG